jgi:hypothetical protein
MEQQGSCGLDFEGGPGSCGMVVPEADSSPQSFMLTDEPAELDIVQIARQREDQQ